MATPESQNPHQYIKPTNQQNIGILLVFLFAFFMITLRRHIVTSIRGYAFWYCSSLEDLIVPDNVSEVELNAFRGVKHVTYHGTLDTSGWGMESLN